MFEVGFSELLMLGLVAMLVVGPEQLPKVARTAGLWVGRARRMLASVQMDIERELRAEEVKELLNKRPLGNQLEELIEESKDALSMVQRPLNASTSVVKPEPAVTLRPKNSPPTG